MTIYVNMIDTSLRRIRRTLNNDRVFVRDFTYNRAIYKRARSTVNHNAFASFTIITSWRKDNSPLALSFSPRSGL